LTGDQAAEVAQLFPELGTKPPRRGGIDGSWRFGIVLTRADGTQLDVTVGPDMRDWVDDGSNEWALSPKAAQVLTELIKQCQWNPIVEAILRKDFDDDVNGYQAPITMIVDGREAENMDRLFPELGTKQNPSPTTFPSIGMQVLLTYADGQTAWIEVGKDTWAVRGGSFGPAEWPLSPATATTLRDMIGRVGKLRPRPTTGFR